MSWNRHFAAALIGLAVTHGASATVAIGFEGTLNFAGLGFKLVSVISDAGLIAAGAGSVIGLFLYRRVARGEGHKLPSPRLILINARDVPILQGLRLSLRIGVLRSLDALAFNILPPLFIQLAGRQAGRIDPDSWVTYFRVAQRVMQLPVVALQGISRTALPALSQMAGRKDARGFQKAFQRVTILSGCMTSLGVVVALLLVRFPVEWLLEPDFHEPVPRLCAIMALGYGLVGFTVAYDAYYIVTNQLRLAVYLCFASMLVSFPVLYVLCYHLPETGAAWGMVVNYNWGVLHLILMARYFRSGRLQGAFGPVEAAVEGGR